MIEDEEPARRFISTALRSLGYDVLAVASAENAEVVLEETRPDLIVVDIRLPGADGLSFAQRIGQDDDLKDVPLLLISAYGRPRGQLAIRFLAKPFELVNFERVVAEMIS